MARLLYVEPRPTDANAHDLRALLLPFISKRVDAQDVDDVLQSVFVRIQRGLHELRDGDKLVAWSYQIARNVIVDHARRRAVRAHEPLDRMGAIADPSSSPDDNDEASELSRVIAHFVAMLPDPYRDALRMTELEGITQAEAATRAGLTLPGMKSRVQRARSKLRGLLESCCEIELDPRGGILNVEPSNPPEDLPNCCAKETVHPPDRTRVSRDMTHTQDTSKTETSTPTTETPASCCGGPAPAGTSACCVKDAVAKAAGESGCGCSTQAAKKSCC